ncbi:uncharacterized protein LOC111086839 [Limulus polyphemus]|uniref:Uncharacterized protein LOC111086839 n=1 Tax=Limulus polyphemus TaxID=6850 RepID=A0ABM1STV4_LIMPO|nr:uncharacterized protein LOC111086839 [Limulus polyphemus]
MYLRVAGTFEDQRRLLYQLTLVLVYCMVIHSEKCNISGLIKPCTCEKFWNDESFITCSPPDDGRTLMDLLEIVANHFHSGKKITFCITGCDREEAAFPAFPYGFFSKLNRVKEFQIEVRCDFAFLSPPVHEGTSIFDGLTITEKMTVVISPPCQSLNGWDWSLFLNIKFEENATFSIDHFHSRLDYIPSSFSNLGEHIPVKDIKFVRVFVSKLPNYAFSKFWRMEEFNFTQSLLSVVRRSDFPTEATYLRTLDLSGNKLQILPDDLFSNMPILKVVALNGNNIYVLQEQLFRNIAKHIKFNVSDLPLYCNCSIHWIISRSGFEEIEGECFSPEHLKNKPLNELKNDDLSC